MRHLFEKFATRRNLFILVIFAALCNVMLLLFFANFDMPILDTYLFYTSDEAYHAIESYGEHDRMKYIRGTLMLDFIYPVFYCLMLAFALFRLRSSVGVASFPLSILPIDYLENSLIIFLISKYPVRYEALAGIAGIFTLTKWLMVAASVLVILALFLLRVSNNSMKD